MQSYAYSANATAADPRVEDILSRMTLEEKIDYIGGINEMYIRSIDRLGVPEIKLTDGPVGTHKDGRATAYPAGVTSASTWNRNLLHELGVQLGRDSRARGVHILLAPGMNILRAPMCGRNYEYFSEDPYLTAQATVEYVKGVQEQGVAATLKHFAANNQEWDRNNVSSDMDMRTLHEIYLPAFKAGVIDADAGCVMDSYNPVNGVHATQNAYLNNHVLRDLWGFDGVVMSDWSATYDAVEAANGGLDLEMPRGKFMNRANLIPAIEEGKVSVETIDEKVRRILSLAFKYGFFDRQGFETSIPLDNPEGARVALDLAREGVVLLKNEQQLLPARSGRIAVIGPNAASYNAGGGSSYTFPFHSTSLLDGMRSLAPQGVEVVYNAGLPTLPETVEASMFYTAPGSQEVGLKGEYYPNPKLQGEPALVKVDSIVKIDNGYHIAAENRGLPFDHCSMRWSGVVRPEKSADYRFVVRGFDGFRLKINGEQKINEWRNQGITLREVVVPMEAGKEYPVELEYFANVHPVDISFGWREERLPIAEAAEMARGSEIAVVSVGFNNSLERESNDRPFELPQYHDDLIEAVVAANPRTVVVVNAGSNVDMSRWIDKVPAIIWAGYPGQEGGTALAEIIYGMVNPSGKLPVSFERKWEDNPAYNFYYDADGDKRVEYGEGLMLGYRHYDTSDVKPNFPFGHGLSYTTFKYSDLKTKKVKDGVEVSFSVANTGDMEGMETAQVEVSFNVANTGDMDGMETAQVYVRPINPKVVRPYKELKGFEKRMIAKGGKERYKVLLPLDAFSYFDPETETFVVDPGKYEIIVAASSSDIRLRKTIKL